MYTFNQDINNEGNSKYQAKSSEIPSNVNVLREHEFMNPK